MRTKWTIAIDGRATRVEEEQKWWETMMVEGPGRTRGERWMDPGGKGMQDIAAPRDTRGRNLHDGTGDVLQIPQSSNHEVTRGFHVWMAHSPWLVFRKISIYSDYRFSSCTLLVFSPFPGGLQAYRQSEFYPCSLPPISLLGCSDRRNKDFIFYWKSRWWASKLRGGETLLALQISFITILDHNSPRWRYHFESSVWYMECKIEKHCEY